MAENRSTVLSDYICIKQSNEGSITCRIQNDCPSPTSELEVFHSRWVVLTSHTVPHWSSISDWESRETWLSSLQQKPQIELNHFQLVAHEPDLLLDNHNLEIILDHCSLLMVFNELHKYQKWYEALQTISKRVYAEIVRSTTNPEREKQYVVEMTPSIVKFYYSKTIEKEPSFVWMVKSVQRAKYDTKVGKLEVDVWSGPDTTDKYMLVGFNIKDLYHFLKKRYNEINPHPMAKDDLQIIKLQRSLSLSTATSLRCSSDSRLDSWSVGTLPLPVRPQHHTLLTSTLPLQTRHTSLPLPARPERLTRHTMFLKSPTQRRSSEPAPPPLPPRPPKLSRSPSSTNFRSQLSPSIGVQINFISEEPPPPLPPRSPTLVHTNNYGYETIDASTDSTVRSDPPADDEDHYYI